MIAFFSELRSRDFSVCSTTRPANLGNISTYSVPKASALEIKFNLLISYEACILAIYSKRNNLSVYYNVRVVIEKVAVKGKVLKSSFLRSGPFIGYAYATSDVYIVVLDYIVAAVDSDIKSPSRDTIKLACLLVRSLAFALVNLQLILVVIQDPWRITSDWPINSHAS